MKTLTLEQVREAGRFAYYGRDHRVLGGHPSSPPYAADGVLVYLFENGREVVFQGLVGFALDGGVVLPSDGWKHLFGCDCEFCHE